MIYQYKQKEAGVACTMNAISMVNIVMGAVIVVMGLFTYLKSKHRVALYVAIAFAFFEASHVLAAIGNPQPLCTVFIIRLVGYLLIVLALYGEIINK